MSKRRAGGNDKKPNNKKRRTAPSNRAAVRAALAVTPVQSRGTKAMPNSSGAKQSEVKSSSSKKKHGSGAKVRTPGAPKNTNTYLMNVRKFGQQPSTPRPLSGMKSPRLESIATAGGKPPASGLDMFGSMLGAMSPGAGLEKGDAAEQPELEAEHSAEEVIKLCSIITEQAKTIAKLEAELKKVRAELQARAVAPVPTLKRATSTSLLTSRIGKLFNFS